MKGKIKMLLFMFCCWIVMILSVTSIYINNKISNYTEKQRHILAIKIFSLLLLCGITTTSTLFLGLLIFIGFFMYLSIYTK